MDAPVDFSQAPPRERHAIALVALAPLLPQIVGSIFNIWYNLTVIDPLLGTPALRERFKDTVLVYNTTIYPCAIVAWVWLILSLRKPYRTLWAGGVIAEPELTALRRRIINLPWSATLVTAAGWLLCIPVFLGALASVGDPLKPALYTHFPVSIVISALIAMTHSFFLVETTSQGSLYRVFFRGARADTVPGSIVLSLRQRGVMWAVSAGICPIVSLLLLDLAPPEKGAHPAGFAVFVGSWGIAFGLYTAWLMGRLVAHPVDRLRQATQSVSEGRLDAKLTDPRPDEFGHLFAEFNRMIAQLEEKERLRQTFGLHVGEAAAEQILARDPGLGGVEQIVTIVFVDIRAFTARSGTLSPERTVAELNEFLRVMVDVVERRHRGMINKFLGDGFMALFGVGHEPNTQADRALAAAREMVVELENLNRELARSGSEPFRIGIGIHTGPAVVGSIGSPQRLEFTAIGSAVNLAARIEQLTKAMGTVILFTAATEERLGDRSGARELEPQAVRGVDQPVRVFTISGPSSAS